MALALHSTGMSLCRRSCLHLETPLKNYDCVDLPQKGRQQTGHWDHEAASVRFGFLGILVILLMGLLLKSVGLCSIILW